MKKFFKELLPAYIFGPLAALILSNIVVYYGARLINNALERNFYDLSLSIDTLIPVLPVFSVIYILAFPFWYVSYYFLLKSSKYMCYRITAADVAAKLFCGLIFIIIPSTNVRPEISGSGVGSYVLNLIYSFDSADNLFPSVHCLESWICYIGLRNTEIGPKWIKTASLIFALAICFSTIFTKQHVLVDVFAGILLAEVFWKLSSYLPISKEC